MRSMVEGVASVRGFILRARDPSTALTRGPPPPSFDGGGEGATVAPAPLGRRKTAPRESVNALRHCQLSLAPS